MSGCTKHGHSYGCEPCTREQLEPLLAAERTLREQAEAQVEADAKWAAFGAWAFENFWHDGEPGDIEGGDAQEAAVRFGLLGRTSEHDAGATHAEGCDFSPEAPPTECCCYTPLLAIRALGEPDAAQREV